MDEQMTAIPYENVIQGNAQNVDRECVRMLRLAGESCTAIAEQIGLTEEQVIEYCRQLGLPVNGSCRFSELGLEEAAWLRHREGNPREESVLCAAVRCSSRSGAGGENFVLTNARSSGGMTSGGRKAGSKDGWLNVRIVGNGLLR